MSGAPFDLEVCEGLSVDLIEFATGTLTGRDRSRVLEHLAACARCRNELESLARVADAMLEFAPSAEPSWGFDQRLIERYRLEYPRATRRRLSTVGKVAAAVILLSAGVALGAIVTSHHPASPSVASRAPVNAQLTSHGAVLGHVFLSGSHPEWLYMTFNDQGSSRPVWCRVTLANGVVEDLGRFTLTGGYGAWGAPVDPGTSRVTEAQVTDGAGHVLASADLST